MMNQRGKFMAQSAERFSPDTVSCRFKSDDGPEWRISSQGKEAAYFLVQAVRGEFSACLRITEGSEPYTGFFHFVDRPYEGD